MESPHCRCFLIATHHNERHAPQLPLQLQRHPRHSRQLKNPQFPASDLRLDRLLFKFVLECLPATFDLSCGCRTGSDQYAWIKRHGEATPLAQCKLSVSPKPYPGLALATAAGSCGGSLTAPLSSPLDENTNFVVAAGEQSKGKAPDRAAPQSSGRTSSTLAKNQTNKQPPRRRSRNDTRDNEQNSDDEDREEDHEAEEEGSRKKLKTLRFRCPKYAADPAGCDPKCEDWHSYDIASVTRHAKGDAKDTADKLAKISSLKSTKFPSSSERWAAYYAIFGEDENDLPTSQPYFDKSGTSDISQMILQACNTLLASRSTGDERFADFIAKVEHLKEEQGRRDRAIEREKQESLDESRKNIQHRADDAIQDSNEQFREALNAAINEFSNSQPVSNRFDATKRGPANAMLSKTTQEHDLRGTGGAATTPIPKEHDLR